MQAKALYNLLRYSWRANPALKIEPWQVENLRDVSSATLFSRLERFEIYLDEERFLSYAQETNSPEELIEFLWIKEEKNLSDFDQTYLLLFELWRRFLPDQQSISLFCDELDHRIALYDAKEELSEALLLESLVELENILDENVDHGEDPQEVFGVVSSYCAHDLESFLYDYIIEQISADNVLCASELIEAFYEYVTDQRWFHFLRVITLAETDFDQAELVLRRLLEEIQEDPDCDLLLEIVDYLADKGNSSLFLQSVRQALALLQKEGQFQELLNSMASFYRSCGQEADYQAFFAMAQRRQGKDAEAALDKESSDYQAFKDRLGE